jgi:hypothetical protein
MRTVDHRPPEGAELLRLMARKSLQETRRALHDTLHQHGGIPGDVMGTPTEAAAPAARTVEHVMTDPTDAEIRYILQLRGGCRCGHPPYAPPCRPCSEPYSHEEAEEALEEAARVESDPLSQILGLIPGRVYLTDCITRAAAELGKAIP